MTRKLVYAAMTGGFGSLAQVMPVLECLDPSQYRIVVSIAHGAAKAVRRLGYDFIAYPDVPPADPDLVEPKGREAENLDVYWGRFGFGDAKHLAALVESRLRIVEQLKPDILLTQFCPPTELIARIAGIPLVCFTQSCWHPRGRALSWWHREFHHRPRRVTAAANALLRRFGKAEIDRIETLNQGDLTLIPSFPEFDPIDDPSVHYLGLLAWNSATEIAPDENANAASVRGGLRPLIAVYTGHLYDSGGESGKLILDAVRGGLSDIDADVVLATGLGQEKALHAGGTAGVRVAEWLPFPILLQRCSLFIHHGGHGSCMAGLLAKVPALAIPTFQEREFNARQLRALGLGDFLTARELVPELLKRKVTSGLNGADFAPRLEEWHSEIAQRGYGGGKHGASLIAELAESGATIRFP